MTNLLNKKEGDSKPPRGKNKRLTRRGVAEHLKMDYNSISERLKSVGVKDFDGLTLKVMENWSIIGKVLKSPK